MTKDEAMKLALEALEALSRTEPGCYNAAYIAITALREALDHIASGGKMIEQLEQQEPVAIVAVDGVGQIQVGWITKPQHNDKLYTSPPQRTWVGLTIGEIQDLIQFKEHSPFALAEDIEAKLKEKNT